MRIFVLDDMEERLVHFRKWYREHEYIDVKRALSGINILKDHPRYDVIFLDHDLEDEHYNGYGYCEWEATGHDVAQFIAAELPAEKRPKCVVVHSWNPDGAKRMAQTLADAGIKVYLNPFKAGPKFMDVNEI